MLVGPIQTNCYIFSDQNTVVVVDPGFPDQNIIKKIRELSSDPKVTILLTHGHADHFSGVDLIASALNVVAIYINKGDEEFLYNPRLNCSPMFGIELVLQHKQNVKFIKEGDILNIGKYAIRIVETPGHTPGGVLFVFDLDKIVFCGDTVFHRGYGRTDLPGGNSAHLARSLREKVGVLPHDFRLYPGHGESTLVGEESL